MAHPHQLYKFVQLGAQTFMFCAKVDPQGIFVNHQWIFHTELGCQALITNKNSLTRQQFLTPIQVALHDF